MTRKKKRFLFGRMRPQAFTMSGAEYHHLRARVNGHQELAALLELIYRRHGLTGLAHLKSCLLCSRPSGFACLGVFLPTTPGAIRKARWLVWSGRHALNRKPMFVYCTCATCARTHANNLAATVERALLAFADVLMSKAGLTPPNDALEPSSDPHTYLIGERLPFDQDDLNAWFGPSRRTQ